MGSCPPASALAGAVMQGGKVTYKN